MDLGVVAHVHREAGMKKESPDACRVRMPDGELAERVRKGPPFRGGARWHSGFWFNHDGRRLPATGTEADEGTTRHPRMCSEHLLARFGVHRTIRRFYTFGHTSTEPEAADLIKIAAITHAMPDRARWRGSSKFPIPNFR